MRSHSFGRRHALAGVVAVTLTLMGVALVRPVSAHSVRSGAPEGRMGPVHMGTVREWTGFYDGHKVVYLNTDVSTKGQARMMGINFAPGLQHVNMASMPEIYLIQGRAAAKQLAVFGSEPGEKDYSPLWRETILTWKAGATPVLVTSDTQVDALEKQGKMTERDTHVLLNCPTIHVM